jgi:hypothetical protein
MGVGKVGYCSMAQLRFVGLARHSHHGNLQFCYDEGVSEGYPEETSSPMGYLTTKLVTTLKIPED